MFYETCLINPNVLGIIFTYYKSKSKMNKSSQYESSISLTSLTL